MKLIKWFNKMFPKPIYRTKPDTRSEETKLAIRRQDLIENPIYEYYRGWVNWNRL